MKTPFKFLGTLSATVVFLTVISQNGFGQNSDPNTMSKEERDAYFAKLRDASEADHKRMMKLLNIDSIRRGANGNDPNAPNAANYDESKANPFPDLPDPLVLKDGKNVTSAKMWWNQRRPEIVEDFDREFTEGNQRIRPR